MKKLRWHKQETEYSCLPACLKSVLEYYGILETEGALRIRCKSKAVSTHPLNAVECARSYGLESYLDNLNVDELRNLLKANIPPIINLLMFESEPQALHSVILTSITKKHVKVINPESGFVMIPLHEFLHIWNAADQTAIVIKKPS